MAKLKKLAAVCTAAMMAWSLTGCSDTTYVMKNGDDKVNAGVYIYNMLNSMYGQMTMMYYQDGITENYMDQKVDGKSFSDYLSEQALKSTKEYAAIVDKFDELKLKLTDEEIKQINSNVNDMWKEQQSKEMYEDQGISKESVKLVQKASSMRSKIFDYYYAEGGIEEVKDSDLQKYVSDNYIRYKQIAVPKSSETEDEDKAKTENEESKKTRDEYLKKAEGVSFADFDKLIEEYNKASSQTQEEDSSAAESDESSAEESFAAEETSESESAAENMAADESSAASDDTSSEDSSADESTESQQADESAVDENGDSTAETDPYANETMTNFSLLEDEDLKSDSGKRLKKLKDSDADKAFAYEDDSAYYILIKGDAAERAESYVSENHDSLLQEMKGKDFEKLIDSWVEKMNITVNDKAIKRYTPEIVYEKYMGDNTANN